MINIVRIYELLVCSFSSRNRKIIIDHTLNRWEWPFIFFKTYYYSMPNFIKGSADNHNKYSFTKPIMKYLRSCFSLYESLYYHNVIHLKWMTEEQYNEFYQENFEFLKRD